MEIRLDGKIALVTGASSGIGQGIAESLAAAGADVAINFRTQEAGAEETARRVRASGQRALTMQADVGQPSAVDSMFQRIDDELGPLDILVSNAGHSSPNCPLHETTWEDWNSVLGSNLNGPFLCAQQAARRMIERGIGGRIINISSVHEEACNTPGSGPYCVSKGALRNLTRALALELGQFGITVNDVAPGMILTPLNQRALVDADYLAFAESQIALRRAGTPQDVAGMVLFLCSEHASYCNGGTYLVDGGWMLNWPPV